MAQLVEYDLAKVGVAGSSPVCRSEEALEVSSAFFVSRAGSKGCIIGNWSRLALYSVPCAGTWIQGFFECDFCAILCTLVLHNDRKEV